MSILEGEKSGERKKKKEEKIGPRGPPLWAVYHVARLYFALSTTPYSLKNTGPKPGEQCNLPSQAVPAATHFYIYSAAAYGVHRHLPNHDFLECPCVRHPSHLAWLTES
jgi:hypothetical protein